MYIDNIIVYVGIIIYFIKYNFVILIINRENTYI